MAKDKITCEMASDWLLQADSPASLTEAPAEVFAHLHECPACQARRQALLQMERCWRAMPGAADAELSIARLLRHARHPVMPAKSHSRPNWIKALVCTSLASIVIAAGTLVLMYWPTQQPVQAQSDVIEQLVDWNLELTEAPTPADRERIFVEKHEKLKIRIKQGDLTDVDRELAENLLANGAWLVQNDDPIEELDRFSRMAGRMLEKMKVAADRADASQSERMARQYAKIAERGIDHNLERVKIAKVVDPERKLKIKQLLKEDRDRDVFLLILVDKGTANTQKEVRKALELSEKRHKVKKGDR